MYMRCNQCGQKIRDDTKTCPYCGYPVKFQTRPAVPSRRFSVLLLKAGYILAVILAVAGILFFLYPHLTEDELKDIYAYDNYMKNIVQNQQITNGETPHFSEGQADEMTDPDPEDTSRRIWMRRFKYYQLTLLCFIVSYLLLTRKISAGKMTSGKDSPPQKQRP